MGEGRWLYEDCNNELYLQPVFTAMAGALLRTHQFLEATPRPLPVDTLL
jgi:hypothetical protein